MKIQNLLKFVLAGIFCCLLSNARGQNIILNGSFESLTTFGLPIDWTPVGTFVNWANAPDGVNYVECGGTSQVLTTVPGQLYGFSFFAAGDALFTPSSTIEVDLAGQTIGHFTTTPRVYDPTQNRALQVVWQQFSGTAVATGTSSTLAFQALNGSQYMLDDVQMVALPEPTVFSLLTIAALSVLLKTRRH